MYPSPELRSNEIGNDDVLVFDLDRVDELSEVKAWFDFLDRTGHKNPVILKKNYGHIEITEMMLKAAVDFGYFLADGLGDGIWLDSLVATPDQLVDTSFRILQSVRARISRTDYIACPSCGRTLFNIQDTLRMVKSKTTHLKGLKIGVMGCCVNGPGEMADADYGYVGAGKGKITLYKGKKIIKTGVKETEALDVLLDLIKANGDLH
jgi:(E)-4-hydroxy-3-methylbut-2-enyl-diphosphate synthase